MAVAFDAKGPAGGTTGATGTTSPLTWAHSPASGAALVIGIVLDQATTGTTLHGHVQ